MHSHEQQFFNELAERWDVLRALNHVKINYLIQLAGVSEGDTVLDVGTGTGVLIPFLAKAVGESGSVTALDFAEAMVAKAAQNNAHLPGVSYIAADIMKYQPKHCCSKVVCLNFFPHVKDKPSFLSQVRRLLVSNGSLIIMHDISRQAVNSIHKASEAVKEDRLPPSSIVAKMLKQSGFAIEEAFDNEEIYFVKGKVIGKQ